MYKPPPIKNHYNDVNVQCNIQNNGGVKVEDSTKSERTVIMSILLFVAERRC